MCEFMLLRPWGSSVCVSTWWVPMCLPARGAVCTRDPASVCGCQVHSCVLVTQSPLPLVTGRPGVWPWGGTTVTSGPLCALPELMSGPPLSRPVRVLLCVPGSVNAPPTLAVRAFPARMCFRVSPGDCPAHQRTTQRSEGPTCPRALRVSRWGRGTGPSWTRGLRGGRDFWDRELGPGPRSKHPSQEHSGHSAKCSVASGIRGQGRG